MAGRRKWRTCFKFLFIMIFILLYSSYVTVAYVVTLIPIFATVKNANSLDPDETPRKSSSDPDPSCLTDIKIIKTKERIGGSLEIGRRQIEQTKMKKKSKYNFHLLKTSQDGVNRSTSSSDAQYNRSWLSHYIERTQCTVHDEGGTNTHDSVDHVYKERLARAGQFCENYTNINFWKKLVPKGVVWSYGGPAGIHYCITPKVGCTYWKRIFRFLSKDYPPGLNVLRPSDIDRRFVHNAKLKTIKETSVKERVSMQAFSVGKMFMFARDPYSRLWSTYIDKFLLPDYWWSAVGKKKNKVRTNKANIWCSKNITFTEFLEFVVATQHSPNLHWAPIHTICSPCHVHFDVIGKQETFSVDSKYILNRYGLGYLVEEDTSVSRAKEETSMLITYNFGLEQNGILPPGCFMKLEVASRLWTAFQYNGYIHKDTPFPDKFPPTFRSNPTKEFSRLVHNTIEDQQKRGVNLHGQKREAMAEAYKSVPKDLLKQIQDHFRYDFELFDYDLKPKDLF